MRLEAINLGHRETIALGARRVETGIDKRPVERARIGPLGLAGDVVADEQHHGGPDQAVYIYGREDYEWWEAELGQPLEPGMFGENLTVSGFGSGPLRPGDRLTVGAVVLELTSPRIPCSVFAHRMGEDRWVKRFRDAERPGAYARVLQPGEVETGDPVERHSSTGPLTLVEHFRLHYDQDVPPETIERALAAPVSSRERASLEARLAASAVG